MRRHWKNVFFVLLLFFQSSPAYSMGPFQRCWEGLINVAGFKSPPFRELPKAVGPSDGTNLTVRVDGYVNNPKFNEKMGNAIQVATNRLKEMIHSGSVTQEKLDTVLDEIGIARRNIEKEAGNQAANDFGYRVPRSPEEWTKAHDAGLLDSPKFKDPNRGMDEGYMYDAIKKNNRHKAYYDAAEKKFEELLGEKKGKNDKIEVKVAGKEYTVNLTYFLRDPFTGQLQAIHPNYRENKILVDAGMEILTEVLRNPTLTEKQAMEKIAEAHFLLMHGTPFMRGTPACVSALIDATLRAKFNKTLPPPKAGNEPFWIATFAGKDGMRDFIRNYRDIFE